MLKPFTDHALIMRSTAALLVTLLLSHGCASVDVPVDAASVENSPQLRSALVSDRAQSDGGNEAQGLPEWRPEVAQADYDAPLLPAPKVRRGNAAAFETALAALRSGRLADAEVLLLEITANQPELAGPWINLGHVYVMLEKLEDARMAFGHAIAANPRSCVAYNQLGVLSRQFGDFRSAEAHYRACLEQVPNFKDAYLNLGILYELYLGKLPEALEAYRRYQLLATEPDRKVKGWVMDLERRLGV